MNLSAEVAGRCAKAVKMNLGEWILDHPLPAIVEPKYDGRRVFVFYSRGKMVCASKHNGTYTKTSMPALFADLPAKFNADTLILDAEAYPKAHPDSIAVFDILEMDGHNIEAWSLNRRRAELLGIFDATAHFHIAPAVWAHSDTEIRELKERIVANGFEGVMVKDPHSAYGSPTGWLKQKKTDTVDAIILGPDPENDTFKRTGISHSWFIGLYNEKGELEEWGKVGSYIEGVNPALIRKNAVVEILYQEITRERKFRDPRIIGIRDDKVPAECRTDQVEGEA